MFASVDCHETPAVEVNGSYPAGVTIPTRPVVDGRREDKDVELVSGVGRRFEAILDLVVVVVILQKLAHAPHGDAAVFYVWNEVRKVIKWFKKCVLKINLKLRPRPTERFSVYSS